MILDYLISKYLDGELSHEEDQRLRNLVAADPLARQAYESAAMLHVSMATEPDADVPRDVDEGTLQLVTHMAMSAQSGSVPLSRVTKRLNVVVAGILALLILFIGTPFGGKSVYLPRVSMVTLDSETTIDPTQSTTDSPIQVGTRDGRAIVARREILESSGIPVALGEHSAEEHEAIAQGTIAEQTNAQQKLHVNEALEQWIADVEDRAVHSPAPNITAIPLASGLSSLHSGGFDLENHVAVRTYPAVLVTTMYRGLAQSNSVVGPVVNLSQGVSYGISENMTVGLEVGSMTYDVRDIHRGTFGGTTTSHGSAAPVPASMSSNTVPVAQEAAKTQVSGRSAGFSTTTFESIRAVRSVWGLVSLQRDVLTMANFTAGAQIGIGMNEAGGLGVARLQLRYHLTSGVHLHGGAELRWLLMDTGQGVNQLPGGVSTTTQSAFVGVRFSM